LEGDLVTSVIFLLTYKFDYYDYSLTITFSWTDFDSYLLSFTYSTLISTLFSCTYSSLTSTFLFSYSSSFSSKFSLSFISFSYCIYLNSASFYALVNSIFSSNVLYRVVVFSAREFLYELFSWAQTFHWTGFGWSAACYFMSI